MKLLQNPIAVGCLALAGVSMILNNSGALDAVFAKKQASRRPAVASSGGAAAADAAQATLAAAAPDAEETMRQQIDFLRDRLQAIETGGEGPLNAPQRSVQDLEKAARRLIAKDTLRLNATFLQKGNELAVINNEVLGVGDVEA